MSTTSRRSGARSSGTAKPDYGVFDPDKFWGQVLPGPTTTTTDQPDAFDARVERAWAYMKGPSLRWRSMSGCGWCSRG